jgi:hypothetical protein
MGGAFYDAYRKQGGRACGRRSGKGSAATLASVGASMAYSGMRGEVRRPLRLLGATVALTSRRAISARPAGGRRGC